MATQSDPLPSIQRIAELQQLIADFSKIKRALNLADTGRKENDVEHSFGLALACWFMVPQVAPELNLEKILLYALGHDIIEIYSGDTYIFDKEMVASKPAREKKALTRLKKEWSDFPALAQAAEEYMLKANDEARFVYTIDKILPPLLVNLGQKEAHWHKNKITRDMHEAEKNAKMKFSPQLSQYNQMLNDWLVKPDRFYKPKGDSNE